MRRIESMVILCCISVSLVEAQAARQPMMLSGYSGQSSQVEREWEVRFRALPQPENLRAYMKHLAAYPHNVGSPYDKANAEWILAKFKSWGLDAHIETFYVLYPTPKERRVEMLRPHRFVAMLREPAVSVDPTSSQQSMQLPTYNIYAVDGDVTAPLVYVNYGIPSDYDQLARMGISVKGAIVIARYGASWRGIKPKLAAEHGAVGCLLYSDPRDDGYFDGDVFPRGPYRPSEGVQRGSVEDMVQYPGDPLTPGVGATKDAKRLPLKDVKVFAKIPTLPLSYGDAQPLLAALKGPVVPAAWRGALPITYHVGPGPAEVHLVLKSNWGLKPIHDVIARIPGAVDPGEWVIRGNHQDAWVNGAEDPISGQVCLLEEARAFGKLLKQGWRPKRTIIYCAWDGEEPGLLGSTEWVEEHSSELARHAAVYINTDSNDRGYLSMAGSHTLEKFINGVAKDIQDPEKGISVWQRDWDRRIRDAKSSSARLAIRERADLRIGALGSGSDYSPFLQHLGIASLNVAFMGEGGGGIYHSVYDDFYWYTHFDDTHFVYCRALAQTVGTAVMRLADADVLPLDFTDFADTVHMYVNQLAALLKNKQAQARELDEEIQEGVLAATSDPQKAFIPSKPEAIPPSLDFAPLEDAVAALNQSAERYQKAFKSAETSGGAGWTQALRLRVNSDLIESERTLTLPQGLPGRPWYRHEIYAPGVYTGYGVKTLPSVREAIEQENWTQAREQILVVSQVLRKESALIDSAATQLENAAR